MGVIPVVLYLLLMFASTLLLAVIGLAAAQLNKYHVLKFIRH